MGYIMQPIFIKEFLPKQILNLTYTYSILKFSNQKKFDADPQTNSLISEHGDYLMETLMDMSTPIIEQNVGKKLWPTYSFFRIYDKGSDLKIHKDRASCEYTVALCLGAHPTDQPYEIFVGEEDETSDYKYYNDQEEYKRYKIEHKFPMLPNNAVIFKGMDKIHWREICSHDHFITVFLHYVDQDGPYKENKFDKREMLGAKKDS
jgi:hypothetical protein|tara:strand:+ start:2945 stop:3559 length:615 start_codon:yes stop_codon:yes gene_type:complete